ncbi:MAG: 50S ribosomal protein L24, partial [Clostridia bacterium]|nr:50S ribosomal protein L24 [Clostridia bacterium]
MTKLKVKKGDNVVVISGKDKGKTGKILQTVPAQNRALVEGVNIITKHQKPKSQKEKGGIIKKPAPIKIDNIMVVCPACGKATRVGKKMVGEHL